MSLVIAKQASIQQQTTGDQIMSTPNIPTPQDAALVLQASVTKTTSFNSAGLDLGSGFAPGGLGVALAAVVQVTAIDTSSGNEAYSITLEQSDDNATFAPAGASLAVAATGVFAANGRITKRYVRLVMTAGGTTPSITYKAWLNPLP
jgi:hypothetical protein